MKGLVTLVRNKTSETDKELARMLPFTQDIATRDNLVRRARSQRVDATYVARLESTGTMKAKSVSLRTREVVVHATPLELLLLLKVTLPLLPKVTQSASLNSNLSTVLALATAAVDVPVDGETE